MKLLLYFLGNLYSILKKSHFRDCFKNIYFLPMLEDNHLIYLKDRVLYPDKPNYL